MRKFFFALLLFFCAGTCFAQQPVNTAQVGGTAVVADPCQANAKSKAVINLASSTATTLVSGTSGKKTYFCAVNIVAGAAVNMTIIEGTTSTCGTGTAAVIGGTTAATGWNFAANGGLSLGNGAATVIQADNATGDNVCLLASASGQLSGSVEYVQQ